MGCLGHRNPALSLTFGFVGFECALMMLFYIVKGDLRVGGTFPSHGNFSVARWLSCCGFTSGSFDRGWNDVRAKHAKCTA